MDLTKDSIGKTLLKFSAPIVLAYLLQSVYGVVDLFVVGHFGGTYALAGVNMGSQILDFVTGIATGLLVGGRIIISQHVGGQKKEEARDTIITMFVFIVGMSVALTILMLAITTPVLNIMQTPAESYGEAQNYYRVCMTGILFIFGYNTVSAVLNGLGDSKTPLYFVLISSAINIVLDLTFVGGAGMGAFGAGLATVIAQACSFLFGIVYLRKKEILPSFKRENFHIKGQIIKDFLKIGLPSSYQNSILNISLVVVIAVANTINVYAAAAVGVCAKINVIFILPIIAMNAAEVVMIGQNIGAKKPERVVKTAKMEFLITEIYALAVLFIWWNFGSILLELFTSDPKTIGMGAVYLKAHCWDYLLFMPAAYCVGGIFAGTGHTGIIAIANTVGAVIARIPISILLVHLAGMGVFGIGLAFPISTFLTFVVYLPPLLRGTWRQSTVKG